jgi:hypothetical protein
MIGDGDDKSAALALAACRLLVDAYDAARAVDAATGKEAFVDWTDIDKAYALACRALGRGPPPGDEFDNRSALTGR